MTRHLDPLVLIEDKVLGDFLYVKRDYPDVFLAGGYLRDRFLGIQPKDVDLFTFLPVIKGRHVHFWDAEQSGGGDIRISEVEVWTGPTVLGTEYPIEIIHFGPQRAGEPITKNPLVELSYFLFGCQQIMYDGNQIITTDAFWTDIKNKTMTVQRCVNMIDAGIGYNKWSALAKSYYTGQPRYKDWKLVIPRKFEMDYSHHTDFTGDVVLCD